MQGMYFIQVTPKKKGGFDLQCMGQVQGQIGQEDWAVQIESPAPVPYTRVLRTAQLRDFVMFDSRDDLVTFGRANWPNLFPEPPTPEPPTPALPADALGVDANGSPVPAMPPAHIEAADFL